MLTITLTPLSMSTLIFSLLSSLNLLRPSTPISSRALPTLSLPTLFLDVVSGVRVGSSIFLSSLFLPLSFFSSSSFAPSLLSNPTKDVLLGGRRPARQTSSRTGASAPPPPSSVSLRPARFSPSLIQRERRGRFRCVGRMRPELRFVAVLVSKKSWCLLSFDLSPFLNELSQYEDTLTFIQLFMKASDETEPRDRVPRFQHTVIVTLFSSPLTESHRSSIP